jgi:hypothetical protein
MAKQFEWTCSITKQSFNQGFIICDGVMYIKEEEDLKKHLSAETKYKSMQEAYDDDYYYYTEAN